MRVTLNLNDKPGSKAKITLSVDPNMSLRDALQAAETQTEVEISRLVLRRLAIQKALQGRTIEAFVSA
jgi:hypothetical protein